MGLLEGIRKDKSGKFIFDYSVNLPTDIIDITSKHLYTDNFQNNVYWFGYEFKDTVSSKDRTEFIHYIKGLTEPKIEEEQLRKFVKYPLTELRQYVNQYHIDCFISPRSNRSNLVQIMIEEIGTATSRNMNKCSFELVKNLPSCVTFDWELFDNDHVGNEQAYKDIQKYVNEVMLPKIHKLDYFSLAKNVKPKYRKYIQNYLRFDTEQNEQTFSKLKGSNILIVDDINTSGSTLQEILRIVNSINTNCNTFIYTLIGK